MEHTNTVCSLVTDTQLSRQVEAIAEQAGGRACREPGAADWVVTDHSGGQIPPGAILVCPDGETAAAHQVARRVGASHLVSLPTGQHFLRQLLGSAPAPCPPPRVIAVTGAPGGAGTSTIALAVALAASTGADTLLVDADVRLGITAALSAPGGSWWEIDGQAQRLDVGSVRQALPVISPGLWLLAGDHPRHCTGPQLAACAGLACDVGKRGFTDTVVDWGGQSVADLPLDMVDQAVVVVRATLSGVLGGRILTQQWLGNGIIPQLVVGLTSTLPAQAVSDCLGLPVAVEIPRWRALPELWESGEVLTGRGRKKLHGWGAQVLQALPPATRGALRSPQATLGGPKAAAA